MLNRLLLGFLLTPATGVDRRHVGWIFVLFLLSKMLPQPLYIIRMANIQHGHKVLSHDFPPIGKHFSTSLVRLQYD